jgi:zinc transport system ATP-binding protein
VEHALELEHISFRYGSKIILDDVSLTVNRGDFFGIVGPNGSGKSTLLKIVVGLLKPSAGKVRLFGIERERFREWTRIGYVAQNATSFEHSFPATAEEVVTAGLAPLLGLLRRPGKPEKILVAEALDSVGALDLSHRTVGELSCGQQQRVFIARSLVCRPELLILDEPTVGVDQEAKEIFFNLLSSLRQKHGLTLLMVTHDIGIVSEQIRTVACLNQKLFFHGTPEGLCTGGVLEQVYGAPVRVLQHKH